MDEGKFSHSLHGDEVVDALIVVCSEVFVASAFVIIVVSRVAVDRKVTVSSVCKEIVVSFAVSVTSTVGIIVVSGVVVDWVGLVAVGDLVSTVS